MRNSARVITLTPAPAIDRTYLLDSLRPGEIHRAHEACAELAGKGVNVSANLDVGGVPSLAVVPLPPEDTASIDLSVIVAYPVVRPIRVNITLLEDGGRTTKVNEKAPPLSHDEWSGLIKTTLELAREHHSPWILLAGTIPAGAEGGSLALEPLFESAHREGIFVGLDTSGTPLLDLARSGLPDVIKPNAPELAECVGRSLTTLGDVIDAAQEVHQWGVNIVLVSLGPDGMVGVASSGVVHASTDPVTVRNTIGAGDASVAGFLSHFINHPEGFSESVARGVAWGALKVQEVGSQLTTVEHLPVVSVTESPDRERSLREPGSL